MHPSSTTAQLIHRTTIALTQLHRLLQQATDILANLHNLYLLHTGQVDPNFQRTFPPLPAPPSFAVPILSPTSSCDSAPIEPIRRAPRPTHSSSDTPPLAPQPPKKKRQPPPPLNTDANWDDWDGEADLKLIELKTNSRLRPNWNYVARRVGFSIEQCQTRWQELQEEQRRHDTSIHPQQTHPSHHSPDISPTPILHPLMFRRLLTHRHQPYIMHPHNSCNPWRITPAPPLHSLFHNQRQPYTQRMRQLQLRQATTVKTAIRSLITINRSAAILRK